MARDSASAELSTSGFGCVAVFQQKFSDLMVAVGGRRVEGVTIRCDSFLRQIRICTVIKQKLHNFQMPLGGGVLQRRPGALVVRDAIGKLIRKRGVRCQQFPNSCHVSQMTGGAQIAVGARARKWEITSSGVTGQSGGTSRQPRK